MRTIFKILLILTVVFAILSTFITPIIENISLNILNTLEGKHFLGFKVNAVTFSNVSMASLRSLKWENVYISLTKRGNMLYVPGKDNRLTLKLKEIKVDFSKVQKSLIKIHATGLTVSMKTGSGGYITDEIVIDPFKMLYDGDLQLDVDTSLVGKVDYKGNFVIRIILKTLSDKSEIKDFNFSGITSMRVEDIIVPVTFWIKKEGEKIFFDLGKKGLGALVKEAVKNIDAGLEEKLDIGKLEVSAIGIDSEKHEFLIKNGNLSMKVRNDKSEPIDYDLKFGSLNLFGKNKDKNIIVLRLTDLRIVPSDKYKESESNKNKFSFRSLENSRIILVYSSKKARSIDAFKEFIININGTNKQDLIDKINVDFKGIVKVNFYGDIIKANIAFRRINGELFLEMDNQFLKKLTISAIELAGQTTVSGVTLGSVKIGDAKICSGDEISYKDIEVDLLDCGYMDNVEQKRIIFSANNGRLFLDDIKDGSVKLYLNGIRIKNGTEPLITEGFLEVSLDSGETSKTNIKKFMDNAVKEIIALLKEGKTKLPVKMEARGYVKINGRGFSPRIKIIKHEGIYTLVSDKNDIKEISMYMYSQGYINNMLTEPELEMVCSHPLRAPKLFEIVKHATYISKNDSRYVGKNMEDALRHVVWSYLLTMEYGPEFSQEVTDAHEEGITDNTQKDHEMDYNNNAVGRKYAAKGLTLDEVIRKVKTDEKVIKRASDL